MYAKYYNCDPLKAGLISRSDQTLPYFVIDIVGHMSGLPGVFLAGLASSALPTMSVSLNTLSATIYDAFIDRWIKDEPNKEAKAARIIKVVTAIAGVITIGLVFVVEKLGTVFEMATSISSAMEGAFLGMFMLALLFPWAGRTGALTGASVTLLVMGSFDGGVQWHKFHGRLRYPGLPHFVDGCTLVYFTFIGSIIAVVVGFVTSYFVGEMDLSRINPQHVSPIVRRLLPRKKFYVGVPSNDINLDETDRKD